MLLLLMSTLILGAAFGLNTGPVKMFQESSPYLAYHVEYHLETGSGFKPEGDWE